jgi:2-polyprenyl-3-methyl-5-hydroxy-6-metoxy-1,4-benzoquinol methylase
MNNKYYDIESNTNDFLSTKNRKLDKKEIIKDIHNRELERINENKQLYVKEKISNCIENRLTIQKKATEEIVYR